MPNDKWINGSVFTVFFLCCSLVLMCTGSQFSLKLLVTISLKKWNTLESGQEEAMWYAIIPYFVARKEWEEDKFILSVVP